MLVLATLLTIQSNNFFYQQLDGVKNCKQHLINKNKTKNYFVFGASNVNKSNFGTCKSTQINTNKIIKLLK